MAEYLDLETPVAAIPDPGTNVLLACRRACRPDTTPARPLRPPDQPGDRGAGVVTGKVPVGRWQRRRLAIEIEGRPPQCNADRVVDRRIERAGTHGAGQHRRRFLPADALVQPQAQFQGMGRLSAAHRGQLLGDFQAQLPQRGVPLVVRKGRVGPGPKVAEIDRTATQGFPSRHPNPHLGQGLGDLGNLAGTDNQRPHK